MLLRFVLVSLLTVLAGSALANSPALSPPNGGAMAPSTGALVGGTIGATATSTSPHRTGDLTTGLYSSTATSIDFAIGGYNVGAFTDTGLLADNLYSPLQRVNKYSLVSTLTALAKMNANSGSSPNQLRVWLSGDSTATMHNGAIACALKNRYGQAGYIGIGNNSSPSNLWYCGGSGTVTKTGTYVEHTGSLADDYNYAPDGKYDDLSNGACETFGDSGGYTYASLNAMMYVQEPDAGNLDLYIQPFGGSMTLVASATANGTLAGGILQYTATPDAYQMKVCANGGNVKVWKQAQIATNVNGVVIGSDANSGLRLQDYVLTPPAITTPWNNFINPDLVMFKMATNGVTSGCIYETTGGAETTFKDAWDSFSSIWLTANPLRDVLIDGSYPTESACVQAQNEYQRQWAYTNNKTYFDGYEISGSLDNELTLGWLTSGDKVHQTALGQYAQAIPQIDSLGLGLGSYIEPSLTKETITSQTLSVRNNPIGQVSSTNPNSISFSTDSVDALATLNRWLILTTGTRGNAFANIGSYDGAAFMPFTHVVSTNNPGIGWYDTSFGVGLGSCTSESCHTLKPFGASQIGVGITPTARLQLAAGTATEKTAPLKFTSGTNLSTPEAGAVEYDGNLLYLTATDAVRGILQRNIVRIVTAPGDITQLATDDVICVNKTSGAATAINLMASPPNGKKITVKDCKGDANTNNITITPNAGTIDGAATKVMNAARSKVILVYTGSEWAIIGE